MSQPYTVILDLSNPRKLSGWQASPEDLATVFEYWVRQLGAVNVKQARVVACGLPEPVRATLCGSPKVVIVDGDLLNPVAGVQRAAEGIEGEAVLLTDGNIWIDATLDALVGEHRASRNRVSLCSFHAGFACIIASEHQLARVPRLIPSITSCLIVRADSPEHGIGHIRRAVADRNTYFSTVHPEGWRCMAWVVRCGRERGRWRIPVEFREGQVLVRESYRRAFRAMEVFCSLEGARVLEVGFSPRNPTGPRMLLEEFGARRYVGVNLERVVFDWRHPAASFHACDALLAPFEPRSFDLVFSLAVWEHIDRPRELFGKITDWLAPGGGHYGKFQVWSADDGYHMPPSQFTGKRPPAYCHLTMSSEELLARLREENPQETSVDAAVDRIYHDPYINRVRASEFVEIIRTCGLEIVYLDGRNGGRLRPDAAAVADAIGNGYTPEELSVKGFEFYLRKSDYRVLDIRSPVEAVADMQ